MCVYVSIYIYICVCALLYFDNFDVVAKEELYFEEEPHRWN